MNNNNKEIMEFKNYKELSVEDKKIYETARESLRNSSSLFGFYQRKDGSWTHDIINILWGVLTPTGKVSKRYFQTMRFDMRFHTTDSVYHNVVKTNAELHPLPKGYKWTEPILFNW